MRELAIGSEMSGFTSIGQEDCQDSNQEGGCQVSNQHDDHLHLKF